MNTSLKPSSLQRSRLLVVFACVTLLPAVGLIWLGVTLLSQDRALAENQLRVELERELDGVVTAIARDITPPPHINPQEPSPSAAESLPAAFAIGETAERDRHFDAALASYRALAKSKDINVRAGALIRVARVLRQADRGGEALDTYSDLRAMDDVRVFDAPASLWAALARLRELDALGRHDERDREAAAVRSDLTRGRWRVDRAMFEHAWSEASLPGMFARTWRERWRERQVLASLVNADEAVVVDSGPAVGPTVVRAPRQSGIPWTIRLSSASPDAALAAYGSRRKQLMLVLSLAAFLVIAGAYFVARGIRRELAVAELQNTFVSAVSHEFRTPLTSMSHLIELLRDRQHLDEEHRTRYYNALDQEAARLRKFVDQLLNFGRVQAGEAHYRFAPVDPVLLVDRVVDEFQSSPALGHHPIELSKASSSPRINADADAITLALSNLLENAAKYSPATSAIKVGVAHNTDTRQVFLNVRDAGPGIPADERQAIFDKFVRGRAAEASGIRGTGVGLALAREIVRAHGGDLSVDSEVGAGSTFTIALPAVEATASGATHASSDR